MILVRFICSMYETANGSKPVHFLHQKIYANAWIDLYKMPLLSETSSIILYIY